MENTKRDFDLDLVRNQLDEIINNGSADLGSIRSELSGCGDSLEEASLRHDQAVSIGLLQQFAPRRAKAIAALKRLDNGTWGICTECGQQISWPRLNAIPEAELCCACKSKQEADIRPSEPVPVLGFDRETEFA